MKMRFIRMRLGKWGMALILFVLFFNVVACATGGEMVNHKLSFDTIQDSADGKHADIEVLDYQYGDSGQFSTYANKEMVSLGKTFKQDGIRGPMRRGEFLYVRWRILATAEVHEDRVDLRDRLPADMEGIELHFVIRSAQLYVFLIYPWDGKPWQRESYRAEFLPIPGGNKRFHGHKYVQIYPDPPSLP